MCQRATLNGYEKAKAEFSAELTDARATIEKLNQELSACMRGCDAANAANSELEVANCELNQGYCGGGQGRGHQVQGGRQAPTRRPRPIPARRPRLRLPSSSQHYFM